MGYLFTYGSGSVLLWRRSDKLRTSGFLWTTQCTRSLGRGYKLCAGILVADQQTHGTTFRALKFTSQVATPGAESAVYGSLVLTLRVGSRLVS